MSGFWGGFVYGGLAVYMFAGLLIFGMDVVTAIRGGWDRPRLGMFLLAMLLVLAWPWPVWRLFSENARREGRQVR